MSAKKKSETWETIARRLRKRGWNYHQIEWLVPNVSGYAAWRLEIAECDSRGYMLQSITVERTTLLACYRAAEAETKRRRVIG